MKLRKEIFFALLIPFIYLIVAIVTIGDYGVSIDEAAHFRRGQGYLHFFLTGKKDYKDLSPNTRRSVYQDNNETGGFYIDVPKDQSHPPLNDTLSALTNYIFYQKLGMFGDVEAHHLFGIFSVTLLILGIYIFTRVNFGIFTGIIASLSIVLYPIFLGESHFNVKDPPESSFFALTIIFFWFGIIRKKAKFVIASAFSCALALGTKFNIVFAPFILLPWLLSYDKSLLKFPKRLYFSFLVFPIIVIAVFFLTNPNLWIDSFSRIGNMIMFYLNSGTGISGSGSYQPAFIIWGFNTYPILAVIYSTPLVILFFGLIGFFVALLNIIKKRNGNLYLLILLWFIFPILRVSVPGTTIYGGIRHIFEFIPALAILSGIGAQAAIKFLNGHIIKRKSIFLLQLLVVFSFIPITYKLITIHPNENVYLNPLIGGLKGALQGKFSLVGNSFGNTYLQGAKWLNGHAEKNACVTTPLAHLGDIPPNALRSDLEFLGSCQSGSDRMGEYAMDMVYPDYYNDWYAYAYYRTYLYPVHQIKIDDAVIFEIFKNDLSHSKKNLIEIESIGVEKIIQKENVISITLPKALTLSSLNLSYNVPESCPLISDGYVILSLDGKDWVREPDNISVSLGRKGFNPKDKEIERKFAAKKAKYIQLITNLGKDCAIDVNSLEIFYHPNAQ